MFVTHGVIESAARVESTNAAANTENTTMIKLYNLNIGKQYGMKDSDGLSSSEVLKLIEYIPIRGNLPTNGRLEKNVTIDSQFYFESIHRKGSLRDIIGLIIEELEKETRRSGHRKQWKNISLLESARQRYTQLHEIGCSYPIEYLLFDFCLAALDTDYPDAALYLSHSYHILGISKPLNLLLSVIVNEQLMHDNDVKRLVVLLARAVEPHNADQYVDTFGNGFKKRYLLYREQSENQ